jgi:hypothetical protein
VKEPVTGPVGHGQGAGTGEHQPSCPVYQVEELLRKPDPGIMRVRAELEVEWWLRDARIPYGPDVVSEIGARVVDFLLGDRVAQQSWEAWLGPVARMAVRAYQEEADDARC